MRVNAIMFGNLGAITRAELLLEQTIFENHEKKQEKEASRGRETERRKALYIAGYLIRTQAVTRKRRIQREEEEGSDVTKNHAPRKQKILRDRCCRK